MRKPVAVAAGLLAVLLSVGCGQRFDTSSSDSSTDNMVYPSTWQEVAIASGFAVTTISGSGHFSISRNACAVQAEGALTLAEWNTVASLINQITESPKLTEPVCQPALEGPHALDGNIEVKYRDSKRIVMEVRGREFCSYFADKEAAKTLGAIVNSLLNQAFTENCP